MPNDLSWDGESRRGRRLQRGPAGVPIAASASILCCDTSL
jgi:hypothetical protein